MHFCIETNASLHTNYNLFSRGTGAAAAAPVGCSVERGKAYGGGRRRRWPAARAAAVAAPPGGEAAATGASPTPQLPRAGDEAAAATAALKPALRRVGFRGF